MNYFLQKDKAFLDYLNILEPNMPEWINEYINTPVLQHQQYISITCGTIYSDLFESEYMVSSLDHSIAVALIIWHFTHNKAQTLAGLFHDISTPVFKHSIDFFKKDYINQEATEDLTTKILQNSKEIMQLLKRDKIDITEVNNYHIYPIADNDTPMLAADRLEYTMSNALFTYEIANLATIKKIYCDITIQKNEKRIDELGFNSLLPIRNFVEISSKLSIIYREDRTKFSMQFLADIVKKLQERGRIVFADLYTLKESEMLEIIKRSEFKDIYSVWEKAKKVNVSTTKPKGVYSVCIDVKKRYIVPLLNGKRIIDVDTVSKKMIDINLAYDTSNYSFLDFNF